jgi:hypothetical protein
MMIAQALTALGYNEFVVRGDTYEGIEWMVVPETIPSKEEVLEKITELDALGQQEQDAKAAAKESALTKLQALGLTEEEIKALIGGI